MKITRIDLWHVAIPLPAPFHPAWIPGMAQTENRFDLIRLETAAGIEGWSAAPAMGAERAGLGALLGPYLLGERADDLESIRQRIREMSYLGWRVGWIEPACWDILGKARGKPVYELLGGAPGRIQLYASSGEVRDPGPRTEYVEARLAEGFSAVKLRVHDATLEEDLRKMREVRSRVGDSVHLMVDANQGWRVAVISDAPDWSFERARDFCRGVEELGFLWVEEPLPNDAYADLARLCREVKVDVAGGELNGQGLPEFEVLLEKRCHDIYQPDAVFTGGIASTHEIAMKVKEAGARYSPHTWTNGIGFAINLQIFGATEGRDQVLLEYPFEPPGWVPDARDGLLTEPWSHDGGHLDLPTRPGLGFEIDLDALSRHGRRFFTATPLRVAVRAVLDRGLTEARQLGQLRQARLADRCRQLDATSAVTEVEEPTKS